MRKKKNYKSIRNNPNMGLNDSVCKSKVGYCTKKDVFLNGEQISYKMCRCKNKNKETGEYFPCQYFIDKEKKPQKFQQKEENARKLHKKNKEVSKKHLETKKQTIDGKIVETKVPICQSIKYPTKFDKVMAKGTYKCLYSNELMNDDLCKKRGCLKGEYGKTNATHCPHLQDINSVRIAQINKRKKKATKARELQEQYDKAQVVKKRNNTRIVYKDKTIETMPPKLNDDEIMLFGKVFKKDDLNIGGDSNESK